jgi:hypothetical protein
MILNWIYTTPTWLWGTCLVIVLDGTACLGLYIFHHLVHIEVRRAHNELTGFTVAVISVTYAVLLAFIAIATWESFTNSEQIVDREADYVGSIYRDTQGLPPAMGQEIRADIRQYLEVTVHDEWPAQQNGIVPDQGWEPLRRVHSAIVTMHPANPGEAVIQAELLKTLNLLYGARSSRLSAVQGHIPVVIWWVIFFGGTITVGYTYLFGFHDLRMHLVTTAAVSSSMALVVVLIIALDWPFRGAVCVTPEAFIKTEESWRDLSFPPVPAPSPSSFLPGAVAPQPMRTKSPRAGAQNQARASSLDPALLLESDLEPRGDFIGGLLGSAFDLAAAARLPIDFYPAADDQSHGVAAGDGYRSRHCGPWRFVSSGFNGT